MKRFIIVRDNLGKDVTHDREWYINTDGKIFYETGDIDGHLYLVDNDYTFEVINCIKVIKDIPNTAFKAGNYYPFEQDEYGVWLHDWNGKNYCDSIAMSYEYADEFIEKE